MCLHIFGVYTGMFVVDECRRMCTVQIAGLPPPPPAQIIDPGLHFTGSITKIWIYRIFLYYCSNVREQFCGLNMTANRNLRVHRLCRTPLRARTGPWSGPLKRSLSTLCGPSQGSGRGFDSHSDALCSKYCRTIAALEFCLCSVLLCAHLPLIFFS